MPKQQQLHIIIAEDDLDDSELIKDSFERHGAFARVDVVKNGRELLDFLKNEAVPKPDVVLTDINMPILNGIEALMGIFNDQNLRHISCFAYSTTINPIYQAKCFEFGAKGFLIKPLSLKEFYDIPDAILELISGPDPQQ